MKIVVAAAAVPDNSGERDFCVLIIILSVMWVDVNVDLQALAELFVQWNETKTPLAAACLPDSVLHQLLKLLSFNE
jgi:hypothetical protein